MQLYFAAYQDAIHVTIPRGLQQMLPGKADLVLKPSASPQALNVGGYIDHLLPHCINHIIVGNLGEYEILLIACDDGDVLAYYTHVIAVEIRRSESIEVDRMHLSAIQP